MSGLSNYPVTQVPPTRQGLQSSAIQHYLYTQKPNYSWNQGTNPEMRPDGFNKGTGYFGPLKMKDGSDKVMTENSITVDIGGKLTLVPSVVPTLSSEELDYLLQGKDINERNKVSDSIYGKAVEHAQKRLKEGLSPFYD